MAAAAVLSLAAGARKPVDFRLSSAAFQNNQPIPRSFSCDGENTSPALRWEGTPNGTKSLALLVRDPDAPSGEFTHWMVYDLPPTITEIPSGSYTAAQFPLGGLEGQNDFGNLGYGGPCPPPGAPHHYIFTLFALNQPTLGLPAGAQRGQLDQALQGKIVAKAELTGVFGR